MRSDSAETWTRDAFLARLYECNGPWVYALILRIVQSSRRAEELVIEVFWRAWRSDRLPALSARSAAMWLRVLARNVAVESLQSNGLQIRRPENFVTAHLDLHTELELTTVTSAVMALAHHEREVFELAYFEGLSHAQIAEILGRSLGTVKTWARTARLKVERVEQSERIAKGGRLHSFVTVSAESESSFRDSN